MWKRVTVPHTGHRASALRSVFSPLMSMSAPHLTYTSPLSGRIIRYDVGVLENPTSLAGSTNDIPNLASLDCYSEQQLRSSISFRKEVATSLIDSVIVGKT